MLPPLLLALAVLAAGSVRPALAQDQPANVLIVMPDDFGVDLVGAYGEGSSPPCTPAMDALAAEGMLFRNAWANPSCAPTRAALLTGRYGFRTGIGQPGGGGTLPLSETTLPEALRGSSAGYATAGLGKWHLATQNNPSHPNASGFDHFAGTITGSVPSYTSWTKTTNGVAGTQPETTYVTLDTTDDALALIATLPEPWFVYVAYHAPHSPAHVPPAGLCPPASACPNALCGTLGGGSSTAQRTKAMVEVLDAQFGRLMDALDPADTYVFFLGDNGTTAQVSEPPFSPMKSKGSVFEGGVNVPLIVRGPGVAVGESASLVGVTDLFATIGDLTGTGVTAQDSISFASVLANPAERPRLTVYAETFGPNGSSLPIADHDYTVRDDRYKLMVRPGQPDAVYDLQDDPFETVNLLAGATPAAQANYDRLRAHVEAIQSGADLVAMPPSIPLGAGGTQQLVLSPGPQLHSNLHWVLGSASGTSPGLPVGAQTLPLVFDAYTGLSLAQAGGPIFVGTLGVIGSQGVAQAAIALPAGLSPTLLGLVLHHAYVAFDPVSGLVNFVSSPVELQFTL